jgi:hypothetical protein
VLRQEVDRDLTSESKYFDVFELAASHFLYANGVLTLTAIEFGTIVGINLGPGGRLLVASLPEFDALA